MRKLHKVKPTTFISFLWFLYLILHSFLSGRWWVWNFSSIILPILSISASIVVITLAILVKDKIGLALSLISLLLVFTISDINIPLNKPHQENINSQEAIVVFNWNTEFWESDNKEDFYNFLKSQNADIYHLQEHYIINKVSGFWETPNDQKELRNHFAGYHFVSSNDFVTISRYPIIQHYKYDTYLRCDIEINSEIISFYNVHIFAPLDPAHISNPLAFIKEVRRLFYLRKGSYNQLEHDVKNNNHPIYISGDFNTTLAMKEIRSLYKYTNDSYQISGKIFPTTWKFLGLKLARIDYNLTNDQLELLLHEDIDPQNFSDHWAQKVTFNIQ